MASVPFIVTVILNVLYKKNHQTTLKLGSPLVCGNFAINSDRLLAFMLEHCFLILQFHFLQAPPTDQISPDKPSLE